MKTLQKDGRTLTAEEIFLDLGKLSEEEIKRIPKVLEDNGELISSVVKHSLSQVINTYMGYLLLSDWNTWWISNEESIQSKTEITHPEFLSLFGESELTELPEKWFIRGGRELENYFNELGKNWFGLTGSAHDNGYFKKSNGWENEYLTFLTDHTEITVADYKRLSVSAENAHTDSVSSKMETTETCKENLQVEFEGEKQGFNFTDEFLKEALEKRGYFVFPKAAEGEFPDLTDFEGVEMIVEDDDEHAFIIKDTIIFKYSNKFHTARSYWNEVRPLQKQITPTELFERLSKYEDLINYTLSGAKTND